MNHVNSIVKTRHPEAGKPVGILNPVKGTQKFRLNRYLPSTLTGNLIEHYWIVRWDLRDEQPYISETLPHPSVHLVFEKNNSKVYGVQENKFTARLTGSGRAVGIKFKPGGFYPFIKTPLSKIKNQVIDPAALFNIDIEKTEALVLLKDDDDYIIDEAENFIQCLFNEQRINEWLATSGNILLLIQEITQYISTAKNTVKVEQVAAKFNLSIRALQRMFYQYVGVTPKWIIKRYRLHDAAELLVADPDADLSSLAIKLGFYDQAHFIKDFKTIIGKTPAAYLASL